MCVSIYILKDESFYNKGMMNMLGWIKIGNELETYQIKRVIIIAHILSFLVRVQTGK